MKDFYDGIASMGYIYLITNTINQKQYIGQTLCNDIETRWKQHKNLDSRSLGRYLLSAYKKYGISSFKFQIICICFDEACNSLEEFYIRKYNCLVPNGYNLKAGGKNSKHHPETLKKMSQSMKGRKFGPPPPERIAKIREAHLGAKNPNFGKTISDDVRNKISESHKKFWADNKESKTKQLQALDKGRNKLKRPVAKYDLNGNLLETFTSTLEAGIQTGICHTSIRKVCIGHKSYKTAGGFVWKFI